MERQEEVKLKLHMVRAWLESDGLKGMVLTSQANFAWLTGGSNNYVFVGDASGEASVMVTKEQVYLLANNIELPRLLDEEVAGLPLEVIDWKWHQPENAKSQLLANQVVAWNPSITGAKSEDTALITEDGPQVLTRSGDWPEIGVELPAGEINRPAILIK